MCVTERERERAEKWKEIRHSLCKIMNDSVDDKHKCIATPFRYERIHGRFGFGEREKEEEEG